MTKPKPNVFFNKKSDDHGEIMLYDEIGASPWGGGIDPKDFAKDLKDMGDVKTLDVRINSPGGSVFDGVAIYNLLKKHPATKAVFVDGMAASAASFIAMVGDTIEMPENAYMMIHNPVGFCMGSATDMTKTADLLDQLTGTIADIYAARTGRGRDVFMDAMTEETWYTGKQALDAGLCTSVTENKAIAAKFNAAWFRNAPKDLPVESDNTSITFKLRVDSSELDAALDKAKELQETVSVSLGELANAAGVSETDLRTAKPGTNFKVKLARLRRQAQEAAGL